MAETFIFPKQNKTARQHLADWFRKIADHIENDELACDPHAVVMCLTGASTHEVVGWGFHNDPEGWRGARQAIQAIGSASFRTEGGNIRTRNTRVYGISKGEKIENLEDRFRLRVKSPEAP